MSRGDVSPALEVLLAELELSHAQDNTDPRLWDVIHQEERNHGVCTSAVCSTWPRCLHGYLSLNHVNHSV